LLDEGGSYILLTKILVGTDGSRESPSAIPAATKIAKSTGSQLHVVCCVPSRPPPSYPHPSFTIERSGAVLERRRLEGIMLLDELVGRIEDRGVSVAGSHYKEGKADREIVGLAEELGVGLIVVGGRDLSETERACVGIFPYFFGDFSDMVFHRARCPVLVIRGEEARKYSDACT